MKGIERGWNAEINVTPLIDVLLVFACHLPADTAQGHFCTCKRPSRTRLERQAASSACPAARTGPFVCPQRHTYSESRAGTASGRDLCQTPAEAAVSSSAGDLAVRRGD